MKMAPAELAALERIIGNAEASPVLRLMATAAGVDFAETEATARNIAAYGMTPDHARAFIAATDTPEERSNIVAILDQIDRDGNRADEYTVLKWAWHEAYTVRDSDPLPPVNPGTAGDFTFRLGLPLFTYSWWTLRDEIPRILAEVAAECAALGIPRGDIIFPMETHSDGGRPGAPVQSWKDHYAERLAAHPSVLNNVGAAGFGSLWIPWNDNTPGKGYRASWKKNDEPGNWAHIKGVLAPAMQTVDWSRCLAAMCNEGYDTGLDVRFRQLALDLHIPGDRLVASDEPRMGAKWHDLHFKDVNNLPALGVADVAMSDNGGSIRQLYGTADIWTGNASPQVDAHLKCLNRYVPANGRIWFYGLTLADIWTPYRAQWRTILTHYAKLRGYSAGGTVKPHAPAVAVDDVPASECTMGASERDCLNWPIDCGITVDAKAGEGSVVIHYHPRPAGRDRIGEKQNDGNPAIFRRRGGKWVGETFEYTTTYLAMRDKRTCEPLRHCSPGEEVLFMVPAICRNGQRTETRARSNLVKVTV